jgi:hypothetical protein
VPENYASLAQLVEQLTRNEQVGGSNPLRGSLNLPPNTYYSPRAMISPPVKSPWTIIVVEET